ncbi:unnamed protein product, partial [marine sediment metagenome]
PYRDALLTAIATDSDQVRWFNELFGPTHTRPVFTIIES